MKKIVIIVLVALVVAAGAVLAFLHETKSNALDKLVEDTKSADTNYQPPAEELEASQRLKDMEKKYPAFFEGGGMQELDFQVRTELGEEHQIRIEKFGRERSDDANQKWEEYSLILDAKERIDEYLVHKDSILEKDLQTYMTYDAEKMELFDEAVKYCEENTSIKKFIAKQAGTENYLRQLGFVLYNADENLCSKL